MAGPKAMLAVTLASIDFAEVSTPAWAMQTKIDGHRTVITTGPEGPKAFNRAGQPAALPAILGTQLAELDHPAVFDGEYARGVFHVFDLPFYDGKTTAVTPWAKRDMALRRLIQQWGPDEGVIRLVPFVVASERKIELLAEISEAGGEGVVFKLTASRYEHGATSSAWRKLKFIQDVDVVIVDTGHNGRNNFTLALADPAGDLILPTGQRGREVGHCSALTGDGPRAKIGDVVTVTVTGVGSSGHLVEAVKPRLRTDKPPVDCTIDQLDDIRRISR